MSVLAWEDPPTGRNDWIAVMQELRTRPGVWALIAEDGYTALATRIKSGKIPGTREGEFEARTVGQRRDGTCEKIYARYVGRAAVEKTTAYGHVCSREDLGEFST